MEALLNSDQNQRLLSYLSHHPLSHEKNTLVSYTSYQDI